MSFVAPWAMVLGGAGALGVLLLHLVAHRRPSAFLLPTARFIPDQRSLVSRAVSRPTDLMLLALRMLLLLCAGAAFAQPVVEQQRSRRVRLVLVDRSAMVADTAELALRTAALARDGVPTTFIDFDEAGARIATGPGATAAAGRTGATGAGSVTAALIVARRHAATLRERADSVELVLLSPLTAQALDSATLPVRALWPGAIGVARLRARADSVHAPLLARAIPLADPLGPALARIPVGTAAHAMRLVRGASAGADDSAFARAGGTVVLWDPVATPLRAEGLAMAGNVVVAPLARRPLPREGLVRARWADGAPAAIETRLGDGCLRAVGVGVPVAGDLALRPAFQHLVRGLAGPCAHRAALTVPADSAMVHRLGGAGPIAAASALVGRERGPSPLVPWLLAISLACGALELLLRRHARGATRQAA